MSIVTIREEKERRGREERGQGEKETEWEGGKEENFKTRIPLSWISFEKPWSEVHLAVELLAHRSCWILQLIPHRFLKHGTSTASASSSCSVMLVLPFNPGYKVRCNTHSGLNWPFQWYRLVSTYLQIFLAYLTSTKWLRLIPTFSLLACRLLISSPSFYILDSKFCWSWAMQTFYSIPALELSFHHSPSAFWWRKSWIWMKGNLSNYL